MSERPQTCPRGHAITLYNQVSGWCECGPWVKWDASVEPGRIPFTAREDSILAALRQAREQVTFWEKRDEKTAEALADALGVPVVATMEQGALVGYIRALAKERDKASADLARADKERETSILAMTHLEESLGSIRADLAACHAANGELAALVVEHTSLDPSGTAFLAVVEAAQVVVKEWLGGNGLSATALEKLKAAVDALDGRKGNDNADAS